MPIEVRQAAYDAYWKFAAHRQDVYFARLEDRPSPWTFDPILLEYKFCNTYRASDRVSQYLIKHVIYEGSQREEEVVFRILLFKIFNKIETWQFLESRLGIVELANFSFDNYAALLEEAMITSAIYTSAYMSCANKVFGFDKKHQNHLWLIEQMVFTDRIAARVMQARSLREVYEILLAYPLIGKFMAYQLTIDLNYSEVLSFSENDFTVPGPGAERGIRKCFLDVGGHDEAYIIRWMQERQDAEFDRLGLTFRSLWGRQLHLIDCQGLFCETDKYCRVALPDLKSNRKRIKARFSPNPHSINYFYPPKWGINDYVAQHAGNPSDMSDQPAQLSLM